MTEHERIRLCAMATLAERVEREEEQEPRPRWGMALAIILGSILLNREWMPFYGVVHLLLYLPL